MRSKIRLVALGALTSLWVGGAWAQTPPGAGASYSPPQDEGAPPPSEGPQGTSRRAAGEERYDRVGQAGYAGPGEGVFATSNLLPAGSHAEVTALDTGKTILVAIRGEGAGLIDLSVGAARQLGVTGNPAIRVRRVTASAQEAALLASGQAAQLRADAPPALLAGLRRQMSAQVAPPAKPARPPQREVRAKPPARVAPAPIVAPKPAPPSAAKAVPIRSDRGLFVQVAALSDLGRARTLADQLGGTIRSAGNVHRVRTGPYANAAAAQRARADAARRGYGDARIISIP